MNRIFVFIVAFSLSANVYAQTTTLEIEIGKSLTELSAAVSCAHPEAARIGAEVLKQGGNAVDASVAMQWALAVCYPQAGNLGGGGFLVLRLNTGEVAALDFRETAPVSASRDMYLDENGNVIPGKSTDTHQAVGVPGSVRGIFDSHAKYGKMEMEQLIAPAIELAAKGFPITARQAELFNRFREEFIARGPDNHPFVKNSGQWNTGDTLIQPELAGTLTRISKLGADEFYTGRTANLIVRTMKSGKGIITFEDLKNYRAIWRKPVQNKFLNYTIHSMPPPSSGGIALVQLLKMWEAADTENLLHNSVEYIHLITEMERRVYADRSVYLGDPDFYRVPQNELLDADYLKLRMEDFNSEKATPSSKVVEGKLKSRKESDETTHLSVVDEWDNAVSVTTTLNGLYGSKVFVAGAGFFLNNEMDDFSAKPGEPNMFDLVGGEANAIEPQKRMLSSMTPTIVEKENELYLVVGSPGGSTIITSVFQTVMNTVVFGMDLAEAIAAPKFHSQWLPDAIMLEENRFDGDLIKKLESKHHSINFVPSLGRVDAIMITKNGIEACGDPRGDDTAAGY